MNIDEQVEIPTVNWPATDGDYKIVQLLLEGRPIVSFAKQKGEMISHSEIIEELAKKLGREYPKTNIGKFLDIPALQSEWYEVKGMGKAGVVVELRRAYFHERSGVYGIGINADHLRSIKPFAKDWGFTSMRK